MLIVGINAYHGDAAVAVVNDGKLLFAAEEERFSRKKHDSSFPIKAIKFCLESQNITIKDIAYIGFYEKPLLKLERVLFQHLQMFPWSYKTFLSSLPSWINEKLRVPQIIRKKLKYKGDIFFIHHHLAHAATPVQLRHRFTASTALTPKASAPV